MPKRLYNTELDEVSVVNRGANQGAKISLFKKDTMPTEEKSTENSNDGSTLLELLDRFFGPNEAKKHAAALQAALDGNQNEAIPMTIEELEKRLEELESRNEELQKSLDDAQAAKKAAEDELAKMDTESKETDSVDKSALPEDVRKQFEDLEKRAKAQEEQITKLEEDRQRSEFVKKAGSYENMPMSADDLGSVLYTLTKQAPDVVEQIETLLKAADEAFAKSDKEVGLNTQDDVADVVKNFEGKVKEIEKRDSITYYKAFEKAATEYRDLYVEYLDEQRS